MGDILKGKVAVITGSGQGTGRAIAIGFAAQGAKVITNNRAPKKKGSTAMSGAVLSDEDLAKLSPEDREWILKEAEHENGDAETTAQAIRDAGGEATACFANIADYEDAGRLIQTAIDTYGRIDILVNVAGGFGFSPFEEMTPELFDRVTSVKPKGYVNTMRHAVPYMIKQGGGRIINTTSRAFMGDVFKHVEYCTANAGVVGLTRGAAIELWDRHITVNAFGPWARTRAAYELEMHNKLDAVTIGNAKVPPASITPTPDKIVPFLVYLASDAADKISGTIFTLAGSTISQHAEPEICKTMTKQGDWTCEEFMEAAPRFFQGYKSIADKD